MKKIEANKICNNMKNILIIKKRMIKNRQRESNNKNKQNKDN